MAIPNLTQAQALIASSPFRTNVQLLAVKAAINIAGEVATTKPNVDSKRSSLATSVLSDRSAGYVGPFAQAIALTGNFVDVAAPTEAEITTSLGGVWNAMAGITPGDKA